MCVFVCVVCVCVCVCVCWCCVLVLCVHVCACACLSSKMRAFILVSEFVCARRRDAQAYEGRLFLMEKALLFVST